VFVVFKQDYPVGTSGMTKHGKNVVNEMIYSGYHEDDDIPLGKKILASQFFLENLLKICNPEEKEHSTRILADKDFYKLSATCKETDYHLRKIKCDAKFWKRLPDIVYGNNFDCISRISRQAAYNPNCMEFFQVINDFLEDGVVEKLIFSSSDTPDQSMELLDGAPFLSIGRELDNMFVCNQDKDASRYQACVGKRHNQIFFRNLSTITNSWVVKASNPSQFILIPKKTDENISEVVLDIGDVVIITPSALSVLTVGLSDECQNRLVQKMQVVQMNCRRNQDPKSIEEAFSAIRSSNAAETKQMYLDFENFTLDPSEHTPQKLRNFKRSAEQHTPAKTQKKARLDSDENKAAQSLSEIRYRTHVRKIVHEHVWRLSDKSIDTSIRMFIEILSEIDVPDKHKILRHYVAFDRMRDMKEDLATSACAKKHFSSTQQSRPLSRVETLVELSKETSPHLSSLDYYDYCPFRRAPPDDFLCQLDMDDWIRQEQREFDDHVKWQEAIRKYLASEKYTKS
jgi:hypothetical protein